MKKFLRDSAVDLCVIVASIIIVGAIAEGIWRATLDGWLLDVKLSVVLGLPAFYSLRVATNNVVENMRDFNVRRAKYGGMKNAVEL